MQDNWHHKEYKSLLKKFQDIEIINEIEVAYIIRDLDIGTWLKAKEKRMTMVEYKRSLSDA